MLAQRKSSIRVERSSALNLLQKACMEQHLAFICAPKGFGKTTLANQFAERFIQSHEHSRVFTYRLADLSFASLNSQMLNILKRFKNLSDNIMILESLPDLDEDNLLEFKKLIRNLIQEKFTILVLIKPHQLYITSVFSEAFVLKSESLCCSKQELPYFIESLALNSSLDLFSISKGIPALLVALSNLHEKNPFADEFYLDVLLKFLTSLLDEKKNEEVQAALISLLLAPCAHLESLNIQKDIFLHLEQFYPIFSYSFVDKQTKSIFVPVNLIYELYVLGYITHDDIKKAALILFNEGSFTRCFELLALIKSPDIFSDLLSINPLALINCAPASLLNKGFSQKQLSVETEDMKLARLIFFMRIRDFKRMRSCARELHIDKVVDKQLLAFYAESILLYKLVAGEREISELPRIELSLDEFDYCSFNESLRLHRLVLAYMLEGNVFSALRLLIAHFDSTHVQNVLEAKLCLDVYILEGLSHSSVKNGKASESYLNDALKYFMDNGYKQFANYARGAEQFIRRLHGAPKLSSAFDLALSTSIRRRDLELGNVFTLIAGFEEFANNNKLHAQIRFIHVREAYEDKRNAYLAKLACLFEALCETHMIDSFEQHGALSKAEEDFDKNPSLTRALILLDVYALLNKSVEIDKFITKYKTLFSGPEFKTIAAYIFTFVEPLRFALKELVPQSHKKHSELINFRPNKSPSITFLDSGYKNLDICLLGGFKVFKNQKLISNSAWGKRKPIQLLAILALHLNAELSKSHLIKELWPHMGYDQAKNNLYTSLTSIRQLIGQNKDGPAYIIGARESLRLDGEYVSSDVSRFKRMVKSFKVSKNEMSGATALDLASKIDELYVGDLMLVKDDPEQSFMRARKRLKSDYIDCMVEASEIALLLSDSFLSLYYAEKAAHKHSLREDVCSVVMRSLKDNGQRAEAIEYYMQFRKGLAEEFGLDPSHKLQKEYQDLLTGVEKGSSMTSLA